MNMRTIIRGEKKERTNFSVLSFNDGQGFYTYNN